MSEKINYRELFNQIKATTHKSAVDVARLNLFTLFGREDVPASIILKACQYASLSDNYKGQYDVDTLLAEINESNNFIPESIKIGDHWLIHTSVENWADPHNRNKLSRFLHSARRNNISITMVGNYDNVIEGDRIVSQVMPAFTIFTSSLMVMFDNDKAFIARQIALPTKQEIEF